MADEWSVTAENYNEPQLFVSEPAARKEIDELIDLEQDFARENGWWEPLAENIRLYRNGQLIEQAKLAEQPDGSYDLQMQSA